MSGIYIPGMEMPKGNDSITLFIYPDGKVVLCGMLGPLGRYTAVSVPEHGRLIDADALVRQFPYLDNFYTGNITMTMVAIRNRIYTAPTVIPADPAKEGEG